MSGPFPLTKGLVNGAFSLVKEYTKLTADLATEDYDYHMVFPGFRREIARHSEAVVSLMDKCCRLLPAKRRVALSSAGGKLTETERAAVMEASDSLLENVDSLLDELKGRRLSAKDQLSLKFGSELQGASGPSTFNTPGVNVLRPQLTFECPVDNSPTPFRPIYYDEDGVRHVGEPGVHPFAERIKGTLVPSEQLLAKAETPYVPLAACPLTFVDTAEGLKAVVAVLLEETEIAVDLEHHDFYSYQGFTCLMQISTRTQDYIIDCLKIRSHMYLLAPVFLKPTIVKVLHGAREDVRWLQKDFGLYIVNLFDTSIALQNLHMPHSLAFAVDHFCQIKLNKQYQTADWRIRPISAEMVSYAQQDTHFLLYVYDRLRQLLLNCEARASVGNMLLYVFHESHLLSLERYEKPELDPDASYKQALGKSLGGLSPSQLQVARDVFNWRDAAAREVDDSPAAVMHTSCVLAIATKLPASASEVLACCSPVSVAVRTNLMKLLQIVKDAVGSAGNLKDEASENVKPKHLKAVGESLRLVGVHRSMTGTLPSVEYMANSTVAEDNTYTVVWTEPSAWFRAMQNVASTLRNKPHHAIVLPGHEVVARLSAAKRAQEVEEAKTNKGEDVGDEMVVPTVNAPPAPEGNNSGCEEGEYREWGEPDEKNMSMELKEGAISLRQLYGTGSANRKRAKLEKESSASCTFITRARLAGRPQFFPGRRAMPFNREILASISFESGPLPPSDIMACHSPGEEHRKDVEVNPDVKGHELPQNEATINLIRCMKWALGQSITNISHPAKQRPLNPKQDFSIKTKIHLDTGAERPRSTSCCGVAAASNVKERRDRRSPFYDAHDESGEVSHLDESDVESQDEIPNVPLTFVDYSPMCYRHIREFFSIDHRAYCDVLMRSRWHSTPTPGKSAAQLFFCGKDWVIKTMTREESRFLRRILHRYYFFVLDHPYTLLPHFVGHHQLQINGEKMYIIIMQNVFVTGNTIHEKYDLKGSTVGRFATEAEKKKQTCTQKDLDINRPLYVGPVRRNLLIEQMKMDCGFLNQCNIMDYSFLVGIYELPMYEARRPGPGTGSREYQCGTSTARAGNGEPNCPVGAGDLPLTSTVNGQAFAGNDSVPIDGRCFTADQGGMMSAELPGGRREIYYVGIIDILQEYNSRKGMETLVFGMLNDRQKISAVPPKEYATRFLNFVSSIIV